MSKSSFPISLVKQGAITEPQRAQAQSSCEAQGCSFAEAVVKLGFLNEEAVAVGLSKHLGHPLATIENGLLAVEEDTLLALRVPEEFARMHGVLPLSVEGKTLAVAMTDPEDMMVVENLRLMSKCEVQPFVAMKSQLFKALDAFYGEGVDLITKTISEGSQASHAEAEEPSSRGVRVNLDASSGPQTGIDAVNLVNAILKQAVSERVSDIHLEVFDDEVMLRFRIDGVLHPRTSPPAHLFPALISRIKILSRLDIAERRLPQDGMFSLNVHNRSVDVRVSVCPADYGEKIVLRLLDKQAVELDLAKIGLDPRQREDFLAAAREPHGLIFLTGPTGSGKTTTLYSLLNTIKTPTLNFMTIEDPIEIKLRGITQTQVKASIGLTFASALRSFLRQDPDVILVGEVRDAETAQTCLRAALTGHLVLSTLHTNDAMTAVARLTDLGMEPYMLASSLTLVAAQRLVRVLCPKCRQAYRPTPDVLAQCLAEADLQTQVDQSTIVFHRPTGCEACARTGYRGRAGVYEVYRINAEMRELIYKESKNLSPLRNAASKAGMRNLRASAWHKVLAGVTSVEEALSMTAAD
ncbi:MAG: Flp pilus assembly complex ATPase component TadA [Elusimicrobia bacterium]|nr:Flp pilus assembly complex ATPase component TadA [Elusimicrobiota bacterium]